MSIRPKEQFIESTRELMDSSIEPQARMITGLTITTDPEVFNPSIFFSSQWFAEQVAKLVEGEDVFIEVGCGTGIVSIKTAKMNKAIAVYATDINPKAAEITRFNTSQNEVLSRVKVFSGDVLDAIPLEIKAQSIFWAMPFGYLDPGDELKGKDWQVFDPGYRAIRKFFATAENFLTKEGRLLIGFSVDIGHQELLEEIARENNYSLSLLMKTSGVEKDSVSMEIWESRKL